MIEYNKESALAIIAEARNAVECELERIYPKGEGTTASLYEAIRYSLLSGGKRIRATLVLETCRMLGGQPEAALPFACAVEMVHAYSLIHDDLPCMDDDDMRRGKPTNHKVYGESHELTEGELVELHMGKTGAMICASVQLGCIAAGYMPNDEITERLTLFARNIGLVFQIVDDILDVTSTSEKLGKNIGSDKDKNKTTFMSFFTPESAKEYAERLTKEAIGLVDNIEGSGGLIDLALYLCDREN